MIPNKRLGQHFLTDRNILQRIVDALEPAPDDVVVEIGAGKGSLTEVLAPRVRHVIAIERDRRLIPELRMRNAECGIDRLSIVQGDALRVDWQPLTIPHSAFPIPHFKVVGNIPYAITSPLIEKALTPPLPERIVFLVQAEVADRAAAPPGSRVYGALSVGLQASCRVEKLFTVKPGAFDPPPRVDSALLRLTPLTAPLVEPEEAAALRAFVTACFSRRRKQLRNVLMAVTGRPAAAVVDAVRALGLAPEARPETLAPEAFARLLRWSRRL